MNFSLLSGRVPNATSVIKGLTTVVSNSRRHLNSGPLKKNAEISHHPRRGSLVYMARRMFFGLYSIGKDALSEKNQIVCDLIRYFTLFRSFFIFVRHSSRAFCISSSFIEHKLCGRGWKIQFTPQNPNSDRLFL